MTEQVEFFRDSNTSKVQQLVNQFLDENPVEYVDAKFSSSKGGSELAEVMIVYRETISPEQEKGVQKLGEESDDA